VALVRCAAINGFRTRARTEANDQEQDKYRSSSNRDPLQKTEEKVTQAHDSIIEFSAGLSDITKILVLSWSPRRPSGP
jgi:hypothetical protein